MVSGAGRFAVSSHSIEEIVEHCAYFYMLQAGKFLRFDSAVEYLTHYGAQSLDEAFITAAAGRLR